MPYRQHHRGFVRWCAGLVIALMCAAPVMVAAAEAPSVGTPIAVGASVTFSGTGFDVNESLSVWETGPDTTVTPLSGIQTDGSGVFTVTLSFPTVGQWQVTAHSINSGKEVVGRYAVGSTTTTSPTATTTPTTTAPVSSPVASVPTGPVTNAGNTSATNPPQVTLGAAVTFTGSGFNVGEPIALWDTAPDATVAPLDSAQADGTGAFTAPVTFPSVGVWQVTAHGRDSAKEIIGRYSVVGDGTTAASTPTGSSTFTSPYAGLPIKVNSGSLISFAVTGFIAGEPISVWVTAPDSTVAPLDSTQASSTGRAVITTNFSTGGLWQITAHGRDSGREIIGKYQVAPPS